jgi:hypothetical protein
VRAGAPDAVDLLHPRTVEREFEDQSIRVRHVNRAAVAMLQNKRLRLLVVGRGEAVLNAMLRLFIDLQCDVMEWRGVAGSFGPKSASSSGFKNLKKASAPPSANAKNT